MKETLLSVGIDIGTTTTQLAISRLELTDRAGPFSVPQVAITAREVIYRGGIHFTPLRSDTAIDADGVRAIVEEEYRASGIGKREISTGAVIITGETARKENAREVLGALSGFAGEFVVATAGPDLESILAARGAGADRWSKEHRAKVLHFDIGGGTSNLALYENGTLTATGCFDVGARLVKVDGSGAICYLSPVVKRWLERGGGGPSCAAALQLGRRVTPEELSPLLEAMVSVLSQAAGLTAEDELSALFRTADTTWTPPVGVEALSFSGGVADCIWSPPGAVWAYGDMGVLLGRAIRTAPAFQGVELVEGAETIRATVVGAGSWSTEVSGSTVFYRGVDFPLKNLPVLKPTAEEERAPGPALSAAIREKLRWFADEGGLSPLALCLRGEKAPTYRRVQDLAGAIAEGVQPLLEAGFSTVVIVEEDMAKALGQALGQLVGGSILCLDGIGAESGDYIDIGPPVAGGAALPVVVKTLAFEGAG